MAADHKPTPSPEPEKGGKPSARPGQRGFA